MRGRQAGCAPPARIPGRDPGRARERRGHIHAWRPGSRCARWAPSPGRRHSPRRWPCERRARRRATGQTCCCRTYTGRRTARRKRKGARAPGRRACEPRVPARPSGRALRRVRAHAPPFPAPRAPPASAPRPRPSADARARHNMASREAPELNAAAADLRSHPLGWQRGAVRALVVVPTGLTPEPASPNRSALLTNGQGFIEILAGLSLRLNGHLSVRVAFLV